MEGPVTPEPGTARSAPQLPRVPVTLLEIVGYTGAAAALASSSIAIGEHASRSALILANLATAIVLLVAGWFVGDPGRDAFHRMRSIFWFLALESWIAAAGFALAEIMDTGDTRWIVFLAAIAGAAVALPLWLVEPRSLQLIGLFTSLLVAADTLVYMERTETTFFGLPQTVPNTQWVGLVTMIFGAAGLALGWRGIVRPRRTSMVLGSIALSVGALVVDVDPFSGGPSTFTVVLALAAAILVLAVGSALGERAPAGIGIVGVLFFVSLLVSEEVTRQGTAIVVVILGLAAVGATILLARAITAEGTAALPPPPPAR